MGRKYAVPYSDTNTNATTLGAINAVTTTRGKIYDFIIGSSAAPADNAAKYVLQRFTATGTSTAVTPTALDTGDPAALLTAGQAHTVEPTYTAGAILLQFATNQRGTWRWVAAPGSELIIPSTASNGIGLLVTAVAGGAVTTDGTIYYEE